jgi:hypothetical protein
MRSHRILVTGSHRILSVQIRPDFIVVSNSDSGIRILSTGPHVVKTGEKPSVNRPVNCVQPMVFLALISKKN